MLRNCAGPCFLTSVDFFQNQLVEKNLQVYHQSVNSLDRDQADIYIVGPGPGPNCLWWFSADDTTVVGLEISFSSDDINFYFKSLTGNRRYLLFVSPIKAKEIGKQCRLRSDTIRVFTIFYFTDFLWNSSTNRKIPHTKMLVLPFMYTRYIWWFFLNLERSTSKCMSSEMSRLVTHRQVHVLPLTSGNI